MERTLSLHGRVLAGLQTDLKDHEKRLKTIEASLKSFAPRTIDSLGRGCYNNSMDMRIGDYISVDPEVCGGDPCFKGTRIMVHLVLELLAAGETTDEILDGYPSLSKSHIQAALMYAAKTVEMGKIASLIQ